MTANSPFVTELVAEECAVLPGMEEIFGLMRLQSVVDSGEFDVVIVDAPPTGDLMKFLRLPDVLHWFIDRYHPFERSILQKVRPLAEALSLPVPTEGAMAEMDQWYARVRDVSRTLADHQRVTVRLVMSPESVALRETQRALSWTSLLGVNVDAVVVNRIWPRQIETPALAGWARRQESVLAETDAAFGDVPVFRVALREYEVIGVAALDELGEALYGSRNPAERWSDAPPIQWQEEPAGAKLLIRLPFVKKEDFRLLAAEDGLVLHLANQRRIIPLPPAVRRRRMRSARYDSGWLTVEYGPAEA
jgi:arsenite/tail-anchored protein-transporting ATPase